MASVFVTVAVTILFFELIHFDDCFVNAQGKIRKTRIGYRINNLPYQLDSFTVQNEIRRAFEQWSAVIPIRFIETDNNPEINIHFTKSYPNNRFDGRGGVNAFTFYPDYGSDIFFDIDENWQTEPYRGKNLFQIATHEIGHALGLTHSSNKHDVMYEFYIGYVDNFRLSKNDIYRIRKLYLY